jgi:hypothetical protein
MSFNTSNSGGAGREGARTGSSLLAPSKFSSNFLSGSASVAGSNTRYRLNLSTYFCKVNYTECVIDLGKLNLLKISLPWSK